jgi:hypothetical protein
MGRHVALVDRWILAAALALTVVVVALWIAWHDGVTDPIPVCVAGPPAGRCLP